MTLTHLAQLQGLAERFSQIPAGGHFVIAATDFGNGLGFLEAWRLWREAGPASGAWLHFIGIDYRSPERGVLEQLLASHPEFADLGKQLNARCPPDIPGPHRLVFEEEQVRLTLYSGDLASALGELEFQADAWLVAPSTGVSGTAPFDSRSGSQEPFPVRDSPAGDGDRDLCIVGAGIAGTMLAANLAGRGFKVTLADRGSGAASGASGNRQGALYVKLGVDYNDQTQLALGSLLFSQRYYQAFTGRGWHQTGLLQLAYNDAEKDRQSRFLAKNHYHESVLQPVTAGQASRKAQIPVDHAGLWFPASGWLKPRRICEELVTGTTITRRFDFDVASITQNEDGWQLRSNNNETLTCSRLVLCAGADTPELIPLKSNYRMKKIRGQITEVPASCIDSPALVICGPGYINPSDAGSALVGATFDLHNPSPETSGLSDRENLEMLAGLLPAALPPSKVRQAAEMSSGRVAFRCTTHDYQPIAGPMKTPGGDQLEGLYLFTGLGSKGLTYAPLLAEYLGDLISGQPLCLPRNLVKRVETQRCHRPQN